jgi:archaellum component FlaC
VNEELENRIAILNARPPSPAFQGDLAEENRRLKSQLAGATARIRKQIDGYGTDWRAKAEAAEAELAKAVEISDTMEDQIERMRIQLNAAEDKATFCAKERDKCAAKVDNLETLLSELYQVLGALDAPVKVLDLVTKVLDGHGFDPEADSLLPFTEERDSDEEWSKIMQIWVARAEAAETELAKLKNTSAISSDIEDNLRKERYRYGDLLAKHGVCTECGDMYEHHEDEPFASCSCHTAEWGNGVSTPYMSLQRALREARDAEQSQAEKVDELKEQISEMKRNASAAISMLQEIE